MSTYGYVRVSTKEQNEARQNLALWAHDIPPEHIFMDKPELFTETSKLPDPPT